MALTQEEITRLEILVSFIEAGSGGPEPTSEIDRAELAIARPLTVGFRRWLASVDGAILADGHLRISPLWGRGEADDTVASIASQSAGRRASGWVLPEELVLIGNDGADLTFGLWVPTRGDDPNVVVAIAQSPTETSRSYWIVGESFLAFLSGWCAAYAHEHHRAIYELLQVPAELEQPHEEGPGGESTGVDPSLFPLLLRYFSPSAPQVTWPTAESAITADELRAAIAGLPRPSPAPVATLLG